MEKAESMRYSECRYADLDAFFKPHRVALVGASEDPTKIGHSILNNLLSSQKIEVYPISRGKNRILGIPAYSSLEDLPTDVDLVIVAVPAAHCSALMNQIRAVKAKGAVIISGGFSESGEYGEKLERELKDAAREAGVRIIGPNCVGVLNSQLFNGTFTLMPESGRISLVSQSGALGGVLIYTTRTKRVGISKFASVGNAADIGITDVIDYLGEDSDTSVIAVYIEGVGDGRKLFRSLQHASTKKPVIVLKGGRSQAGARATESHTGSLAGSNAIFNGMLRQAGCVSAPTLDSMFEIAKMFDYQPLPRGRNIGIISNTGGAAVLAADACEEMGLSVPSLEAHTEHELRQRLSPLASVKNPVDVVATGGQKEYRFATEMLLKDTNIDILLVICVVPTFAGMSQTEHAIGTIEGVDAAHVNKPIAAIWLADEVGRPGIEILESRRIPCYDDPMRAAICLSKITEYAERHCW